MEEKRYDKDMKRVFLLMLLSVLIFSLPALGSADSGLVVQCGGVNNPCDLCDLFGLVNNILAFLFLKIVPPIAGLLIVIGGFLLFVSGGDQKRLTQAKQILTAVVIGLIITYGAWVFINTFFNLIGVAEWNGFSLKESWWKIPCSLK